MSSEVLYIPHGGGPLPLMENASQSKLTLFLQGLSARLQRPDAIVVLSAHWEATPVQVTAAESPSLYFDYYGFPPETYEYQYPCPGNPELANRVVSHLQSRGLAAEADTKRGLDHGVFVPLLLMYPDADIPVIQLSLNASLDAGFHLELGQALHDLGVNRLLWLGSGYSFHNMQALISKQDDAPDSLNIAFEDWLANTLTNESLSLEQRLDQMRHWQQAPGAAYCHPREEHLLPLHICLGLGNTAARNWFDDQVGGFRTSAWYWQIPA